MESINTDKSIKLKGSFLKVSEKIICAEKTVLRESRWDTWHVGGVREHLSLSSKDAG
jgi:hypothetical protein